MGASRRKATQATLRTLAAGLRQCYPAWIGLLFPPRCCDCEVDLPQEPVDEILLCAACRAALEGESRRRCSRCGAVSASAEHGEGCLRCRRAGFRFDAAFAMGCYEGRLRGALLRMKNERHLSLAWGIGGLLAIKQREVLGAWSPDVVVPIPLHWSRRLVHGTNSAATLARAIGRRLDVPTSEGVLKRRRNTLPQAGLARQARLKNVRGAFCVTTGYDLTGLRVMLVDDIMTSGATCYEAAKTLKQAGASAVAVCVAARTPGND